MTVDINCATIGTKVNKILIEEKALVRQGTVTDLKAYRGFKVP